MRPLYFFHLIFVVGFLVVHVDVNTDAGDNNQSGNELNPIVVNTSEKITEDENDCAYDGCDDA